jgi:K+-transporting ATPase ATPase A chain
LGNAFAGLSGNTTFYNTLLAVVMLIGRYLPVVFVLGLAGCLAAQRTVAVTAGTLRTHQPLFVVLTIGVAVILVFLAFLPVLSPGPLAEGLH